MTKPKHFISVIIPAAGSGKRMNTKTRKQYLEINNKPILLFTLESFQNHSEIDEIILVCPKSDINFIKENILEKSNFSKITSIVAGGDQRQDSVTNGLQSVSEQADIILVHDGVRPFISNEHISKIIETLKNEDAAVIAVPVKDTIKEVENGKVVQTPDRSKLWSIQTPQGMKADIFRTCYEKLKSAPFLGTDEAMIAEKFNYSVNIVEGSYTNIKITTPEDLQIATLFLGRNHG